MTTQNKVVVALGIALLLFVIGILGSVKADKVGGGYGLTSEACDVSVSTTTIIGHQVSRTILSSHSGRAWARIQMPSAATNTAYFSFDEGAAAVLGAGVALGELGATTTTNVITFGRNTDFPYTGEVQGITNVGSTTVLVTECRY